jgi:hypothetical protein
MVVKYLEKRNQGMNRIFLALALALIVQQYVDLPGLSYWNCPKTLKKCCNDRRVGLKILSGA